MSARSYILALGIAVLIVMIVTLERHRHRTIRKMALSPPPAEMNVTPPVPPAQLVTPMAPLVPMGVTKEDHQKKSHRTPMDIRYSSKGKMAIPGDELATPAYVKGKRKRSIASVPEDDLVFNRKTPTPKKVKDPLEEDHSESAVLSDVEWLLRDKAPEVSPVEAVDSVERYNRALNQFRNNQGGRSLELLYRIGMRAAEDLTYVVEHMDEPTFQRIENDMEGFRLNRDRLFTVQPKIDFFQDLAENQGGAGDQAFFQTLGDYQNGDLPRHSRRINELVSCINYGDGRLVKDYGRWASYQRRYPKLYDQEAGEKLQEVTKSLTEFNCACGGKGDVFSEFKLFIKTYPHSTISSDLKARMESIDREPADFRFHCKSNSEISF